MNNDQTKYVKTKLYFYKINNFLNKLLQYIIKKDFEGQKKADFFKGILIQTKNKFCCFLFKKRVYIILFIGKYTIIIWFIDLLVKKE